MEALSTTHFGPPTTVLSFTTNTTTSLPPLSSPTDILIKTSHIELNPVDIQKLTMKPTNTPVPSHRSPFIVGYGGSGTIIQKGADVPPQLSFSEGDSVAFLCDANRDGCFATHVVVDYRLVTAIPSNVTLCDAASMPLAGCTAFESLEKVGLAISSSSSSSCSGKNKTLLIVGGAGGVGSWTTRLARAIYPELTIIGTASSPESKQWCLTNGATRTIDHDEIESLGGGRCGSVDAIICLTEPTPTLFASLAEVLKPFGKICLVVAGDGIKSLDLSFVFFKSGMVATETVFSNARAGFVNDQAGQMAVMLDLMSRGVVTAPLMEGWESVKGTMVWKEALEEGGVFDVLGGGHCRGKLVMRVVGV